MSATQVKALRDRTGAGIMDSKRALEQAGGDLDKAVKILREQGLASAEKKRGRTAAEGLVVSYIHANGRYGSLVEVNCETDFVARTDDFQQLARDIALHVVGASPRYTTADEVPDADIQAGIEEFGDKESFFKATVLMQQPFVRDASTTIGDLVQEAIARTGENIVVRRFARFELGESADGQASESA